MKSTLWWILPVTILFNQVRLSESTATLNISFVDFVNPYQRMFDGECCDPACSSACDLLFRVCFNDTSRQPACSTKIYSIYQPLSSILSVPLDYWPGSIPVKILVYDIDSGRNEFVDYFVFTLNLSSSIPSSMPSTSSPISASSPLLTRPSTSQPTTLSTGLTSTSVPTVVPLSTTTLPILLSSTSTALPTGLPSTSTASPRYNSTLSYPGIRQYFKTQIIFNAVVTCDVNFYGQRCDVYCIATSSCAGHYSCDPVTGQKVCSPANDWTGSDCTVPTGGNFCPLATSPPPVNAGVGPCQMVDMVFILDSSGSVNNLNSSNWLYMKNFVKSFGSRVTIGRNDFQIGVITFGDSAQLNIKLNDASSDTSLQNKIDALPYLGQKTNLRYGLRLARTDAFLPRNGGRPPAYRTVVLVYDGETPTPEFGTLVNEAPRLRQMGVVVYVVSLRYYFVRQLATVDLVQNIASVPLNDHLFDNLDSWSALSNTVAPTILANLADECLRKIPAGGGGQGSSTVLPTSTSVPTGIPTMIPTEMPSSVNTGVTILSSTVSGSTFPNGFQSSTQETYLPSDRYCSYRGRCSPNQNPFTYVCCCNPGYAGNQCEYEDDPCAGNQCNGGTCTRVDRLNFTCSCLPGFSGDRCEVVGAPITTCDVLTTTTASPTSQCSSIPPAPCTEFYYGPTCSIFCRPDDTCRTHVSCDSSGQKVCLPGWKNVSTSCTDNDGYVSTQCSGNCLNGGFCFGSICCCQTGFYGEFCEIDSNVNGSSTTGIPGENSTSGITSATSFGSTSGLLSMTSGLPSSTSGLLNMTSGLPTGTTSLSNSSTFPTSGLTSPSSPTSGLTSTLVSLSAVSSGLSEESSISPTALTSGLSGTPITSTAVTSGPPSQNTSSTSLTSVSSNSSISSTVVTSGPPTQANSSSSDSSSTASSASTASTTTLSPQEQLIIYLRNYIRNNYPNLSPVEQQQLLNQLLVILQPAAIAASDSDIEPPPIYTSLPWAGVGRLSNYTVQLEVLRAYIAYGANSTWQVKLIYDYILTDRRTGNVTRVTPDEYQRLSYEIDDIRVDTSNLDPANRFQLVVYGSSLDIVTRGKFLVALRNAYGVVNSVWTAKPNPRVVIDDAEELVSINGEDLTLFNFWLVSNSNDSESPSSVVKPSDNAITSELSSLGVTVSISRSAIWFRATDEYSIFIRSVLYHSDMAKFTNVLSQYWTNTLKVPSGYTVKMVKQEKCYLLNGTTINRLVYFVYNSSSFATLPKSLGFIPPRSEQLLALTSASGLQYELVPVSNDSEVLAVKMAFVIPVLDHVVRSTFASIQSIVESRISRIPSFASAKVMVIGAEEAFYFGSENRAAFSQILWYVMNNGSLVDSRRYRSLFPSTAEWSVLLKEVLLPDGNGYRYFTDDLLEDFVVLRSECFYQPILGAVRYFKDIEDAMNSVVRKQTSELINDRSNVSVVYIEEYINATGSSVSVVFYIIKTPNADLYLDLLDASTVILDDLIPMASLAIELSAVRLNGSNIVLLNKTDVQRMTRYSSLFHLFLKQRPLSVDRNKFSDVLLNYFSGISGTTVTVKILTIEEFVDRNGSSVWGIGYSLVFGDTVMWPEELNSSVVAVSVNVVAITRSNYALLSGNADNFSRMKDLFSFHVTYPLSKDDLKSLEKLLALAFRQEFSDLQQSLVSISVWSVMELLDFDGASIFRIYYQLIVDQRSFSAQNHNSVSNNLLSAVASNLSSSVWTGDSGLLTEVSSLSSIVLDRVMLYNDLKVLQSALQTELSGVLQNVGNWTSRFILSVKRQRVCITLAGSVEWAVDFSAFLAEEPLYLGLLPTKSVDASNIADLLRSNSVSARYQLIDINPPFLYDYGKSFRILLSQHLNWTDLDVLEAVLLQAYSYVTPESDVEVTVIGIEEVIIDTKRLLVDKPSAFMVLYYVTIDGVLLNGAVEEALNSSYLYGFVAQSSLTTLDEFDILDQSLKVFRVRECLKLLFLGVVSSADLPRLESYLEAKLRPALAFQNISVTALQRISAFARFDIRYTEVLLSVMLGGRKYDGNLIQSDSLGNIRLLSGSMLIPEPDSGIQGSIFEESSLFSVVFLDPVINPSSLAALEKSLSVAHQSNQCLHAVVKTVTQFEALTKSGLYVYVVRYSLKCDGVLQSEQSGDNDLDVDNLWAILSAAGFRSLLFDGSRNDLCPVSQLLGIPVSTYVSTVDYPVFQEALQQSATSSSLEFSGIRFQILDQRDYIDNQGNFYYTLMCSAVLNGKLLRAVDFLPLLNDSFGRISKVLGSKYNISVNSSGLRPLKSAAMVYFDQYLPHTEDQTLLIAIPKSVNGLREKFNNLTAELYIIDRVLMNGLIPFYRYVIFVTSPLIPSGCIDLALEPPLNASVISSALPPQHENTLPVTPVLELRKTFTLKIFGLLAVDDISKFIERLQVIWNASIQGCLVKKAIVEEYIGTNGETITVLSYSVDTINGSIIDPSSVKQPSGDDLANQLFKLMPMYQQYTGSVFRYQEAFCYLVEGDEGAAEDNWDMVKSSFSGATLTLLQLQPAFGLYGSLVTRVCYTAEVNGTRLLPFRDPDPVSNQFSVNETVVRQDYLYSFVILGTLTNELVSKLSLELQLLWNNASDDEVSVKIYGVERKLAAASGITLVSELFYGVFCNGSLLRPIDKPAPSVDNFLKKLSLQLFLGGSVQLRYIVLEDPLPSQNFTQLLTNAITAAWNSIPGNAVKVKIPILSRQLFSNELFVPVLKVFYAVTLQNDSDAMLSKNTVEPSPDQLSEQLQLQGLKRCPCSARPNFRIYTKESSATLNSKQSAIITALQLAWIEANPGIKGSTIAVKLHINGLRQKRGTDGSSVFEDSDGNQLTAIDYQTSVDNLSPDPLFVRYPNDSSVLQRLSEIAAVSGCITCTIRTCGKVYISGKVSDDDRNAVVQAITSAFVTANQPDLSASDIHVNIENVTYVKDSSGATISEIIYCVYWPGNVSLTDIATPTYDQMAKSLQKYGQKPVNPDMIQSDDGNLSYETKVAIIVGCCVGGFLLLLIIGLIIGRIIYQNRKLASNQIEQDKQRLSNNDTDSYIGHALYNPSPHNSLSRIGPVPAKLHFHDSTGSDIST